VVRALLAPCLTYGNIKLVFKIQQSLATSVSNSGSLEFLKALITLKEIA
jgi:hypothetical protein